MNAIFVLRVEGIDYLGRRLLDCTGNGQYHLDSRVFPRLLLGSLQQVLHDERGVAFYYRTLAPTQKTALFRQAPGDPDNLLSTPFPVVDALGREQVAPAAFWMPTQRLDQEEQYLREHCIALLQGQLRPGALIHDPACSTGTFITALAKGLPGTRCVGSDLSATMVAHARRHCVQPFLSFEVADARQPTLPAGSCDVLALRFLNAEVMRREDAEQLFWRLLPLLRTDGRMILFGHTPVLLPVHYLAQAAGLAVVASLGVTACGTGLFPFYQLRYPTP